jgi:hypothetical protein
MTFLNPILLWGVPALLLPVVIHLLNRLRYRSVKWAAVMFLVSATRSSVRHARLRHFLILLFRVLVVFLFILALSRPLIGGWLGISIAGPAETIIILLDRSASMEVVDPRQRVSKRQYALDMFKKEIQETSSSSRLVLVENVLCRPQEIAGVSVLDAMVTTGPTDTAADIPAMLRSALDYMIDNRTGRTEIWMASDFQSSNWRPGSREWQNISAQMASLPQDVRVRLLDLGETYGRNMSVALHDAVQRRSSDARRLSVSVDITRETLSQDVFPMIVTLDGTRSKVDVALQGQSMRYLKRMEIADEKDPGGWGKIEVPADENIRDNACYFVYGSHPPLTAAVVSSDTESARYLGLAIAPAPGLVNTFCEQSFPEDWAKLSLGALAMVAWQAELPEKGMARLVDYINDGGAVVFFPPSGGAEAGGAGNAGTNGFSQLLGFDWGAIDQSPAEEPFRIIAWEENEGPLAGTSDGRALPAGELAFFRRRGLRFSDGAGDNWHAIAGYQDGKPFLMRRSIGKGRAYLCTSLPRDDWSEMKNGRIIVPMLQRMLSVGGRRLSGIDFGTCGDWKPDNEDETWRSMDSPDQKDVRWHAGVYRHGGRVIALNRSLREDNPEIVDASELQDLFGEVKVQVLKGLEKQVDDAVQSEIWHIFICCALACMMVESALLLQEKKRRGRNEDSWR